MSKKQKLFEVRGNMICSIYGIWHDIDSYNSGLNAFPNYNNRYVTDNGPGLANMCYKNEVCGCKIVGCGTLQFPLAIQFCDEHLKK